MSVYHNVSILLVKRVYICLIGHRLLCMALPPKKGTPQIVRTMTPLTGTVRGGTLLTERTMSCRKAQLEVECKDISRPSRGRDCGIEEDERSDGPLC